MNRRLLIILAVPVALACVCIGGALAASALGSGDWAAKSLGEAQLVVCAEDTNVLGESCPYTGEKSGTTSTLNRMQNQVKLRLVSARDGQAVATTTLKGPAPRECQDKESFASGAVSATVSGEGVTPAEIQVWLKPNVAP